MKTIYLVSVQPETAQSMPKVYFAENAEQVVAFTQKYEHGSVIVKRITELPDLTDDEV